ncbi:MAG: peptidylprolyl isomerase [Thermoanaerobaculia bacterium]
MLKVFRDNLKSLHWVLWLVVGVMVLFVFAQWGGGGQLSGTGQRDIAATVGDRRITVGEFQRAYESTDRQYQQMFGEQYTPELARQLGVAQQVIDQLINRQLLLDEARRAGLGVTDGELRRAIQEVPAFQDERGRWIGEEQFRQILSGGGYTVAEFEQAMRDDLLVQKLQTTLRQGLFVPAGQVEQAFRERTERAAIRYVSLPASGLLAEVEVEDGAARRYFDRHPDRFRLPERRVAEYLLVDREKVAEGLALENQEIRASYEENRDQYTQPEQVHARHILLRTAERTVEEAREQLVGVAARINAGEDFETVAREVSEDPESAEQGGDLGFFGREDMVAPFSEAAFAAEVGELVGPVETPFGVHLIQVIDRRSGGTTPFEEVRAQIESRLRRERAATAAEERAQALADQLANGDASPATLERLATEDTALTHGTTPPFGRQDHVPEIGRSNEFTETAFQSAAGEAAGPAGLASGWAVLVVREIQAPRLPEFEEVETEVVDEVRRERALNRAEKRLEAVRGAVRAGADLAEAAEQAGLEVAESGEFGAGERAGSLGTAPAVVERALKLDEGAADGPVRTADAAVLFEVVSRTRFDRQAFAEQREQLRDELASQRLSTLLASQIQARRQELTVELNQELLAQVEGTGGGQRVWSSEHGHWHDAGGAAEGS